MIILLQTPIIISISVISAIVLVLIIYAVIKATMKKKAKLKVCNLLEEIANEYKTSSGKLIKEKNKPYDYYLETVSNIYYIKVIYNYSCYEISINSKYKWQYRKDIYDEKIRFIEGITDFVNMKFQSQKKEVKKICLIYPNSRSLLYYINESDIAFVNAEEPLYGINFVTYEQLLANHDYI